MTKSNFFCDSRRLAKVIGWSHKDVMNYLNEETIPYKKFKSGVVFPGNLIARDMWRAYKTNFLGSGKGKKYPRAAKGARKRSANRRKKRIRRRKRHGKKRSSPRRRKSTRVRRSTRNRRKKFGLSRLYNFWSL